MSAVEKAAITEQRMQTLTRRAANPYLFSEGGSLFFLFIFYKSGFLLFYFLLDSGDIKETLP